MAKKKPVVWNGITYPSIAAAARACYITREAMRYRLERGYTCDTDMNAGEWRGNACQWNGITYPSIAAAARASFISNTGMRTRLQKGYTCDDDLKW